MIAPILIVLVVLIALFTTIQTLYVESMRLRTRELPAMSYFKEVLEVKRRYVKIALGIFEEMRRAGVARQLNPRVAVLTLFGMMNWTYTWHRPEMDPQADALAETIAGMFLHGVMNGHGNASTRSLRPAAPTLRNRRMRADNL